MGIVRLSARACEQLERVIRTGHCGREVRRAQALIWLHEGVAVSEVARRTRLSRQALYTLVGRYESQLERAVAERVRDAERSGRPATRRNRVLRVLEPLLQQSPQQYGHRAACWTVPMLRGQLAHQKQLTASDDTIRRALKRLRHRYKRPRFVLSRRSPTWRQAKGGCKLGSKRASVR